MSYELAFHPDVLAEWCAVDNSVRARFKKKLAERLEHPRIPAARLAGRQERYKIKLRAVGYRLADEVVDNRLLVVVAVVGKRERNAVYKAAAGR